MKAIFTKNRLLLAAAVCAILSAKFEAIAQSVDIDLATEHQTIDGFGGMNETTWIPDLNEDQREKAFGNDPGELGLSILRMKVFHDSNAWENELPTALHAKEKGAILFATPWDAPLDLRDADANRVPQEMYDEYVEHLNSFDSFMQENGAPLYAISVQNEPDYGDWTRWTADEMLTFMKDFAGGIENRVIAPESFQFRRSFTDPILNDPEAVANLDIVGGHIYGDGNFAYPLAEEKGKPIWMTEHYTSSDRSANLWPDALEVGTEVTQSMRSNFNAYIWWYIRRFYGFITDDGNISKRGYVFSHFSKFIRPGAVRVEAEVTSAPDVHATAYKTDTSLVIVAINNSADNQEINFNVQNSGFASLTRFTTSETKNVVNEGTVEIAGNAFAATLEPYSISTFTTSPQAGGKAENVAPVANAGEDIDIEDSDGDGVESIMLDGSASADEDGEIANYSWAINGEQLAWTATHETSLPIGEHTLTLTVTDNDGARHIDTLLIDIQSIYNSNLWFEAECAEVGATWEILDDDDASNSKYITTPAGVQNIEAAPTDEADIVNIHFTVTEAANYKVWARVISPSPDDDSFWVKMDDSNWVNWNSIPSGSDWHWDDVHDGAEDNPVVYDLAEGEHTLSIAFREDGALLDKVYIANTGVVPTGAGEFAEECLNEPTSVVDAAGEPTGLEVFPNPASSAIDVVSKNAFRSLVVYSLDGRKLMEERFDVPVFRKQLRLNLESGVYLISVFGAKSHDIAKVVIK